MSAEENVTQQLYMKLHKCCQKMKNEEKICFYPVEKLFKFLDEHLHSTSFHRSGKRAVKKLQKVNNNYLKRKYLMTVYGYKIEHNINHSETDLVHTVALSNNCAINCVLQRNEP